MTYELLFGKSPFEDDIKKIVASQEKKAQFSEVVFPAGIPVSEEVRIFILNLLSCDPLLRMDMDEVLLHPFLKDEKQ